MTENGSSVIVPFQIKIMSNFELALQLCESLWESLCMKVLIVCYFIVCLRSSL